MITIDIPPEDIASVRIVSGDVQYRLTKVEPPETPEEKAFWEKAENRSVEVSRAEQGRIIKDAKGKRPYIIRDAKGKVR